MLVGLALGWPGDPDEGLLSLQGVPLKHDIVFFGHSANNMRTHLAEDVSLYKISTYQNF